MNNSLIISPSLLACDFLNIETELNHFKEMQNIWFHLDVMDGHFVPNLTFGPPIIKMIEKKTTLPLDVHLMVCDPLFFIDELKNTKIHNLTFHYEALDPSLIISTLKKAKMYFKSVGLSIKPNTDISVLTEDILEHLDLVLIMSVEPGFGGQSFIESSLEKIKTLLLKKNKINNKFMIQIDGGVNLDNIIKIKNVGVNNIVAGSYIFKKGPKYYSEKINALITG